MRGWLSLVVPLTLLATLAFAQDSDRSVPIGQRYIDTLPRSGSPRLVEGEWPGSSALPTGEWAIAVHLKPSFRVGVAGMERLVVVEASGPVMQCAVAPEHLVAARQPADAPLLVAGDARGALPGPARD